MAGRIECGGKADGLGEFGGAVDGDAVQRLAPPVVGGNAEARNGAGLVDELEAFSSSVMLADEIGRALLRRKTWIEVGGLLIFLRGGWEEKEAKSTTNAASDGIRSFIRVSSRLEKARLETIDENEIGSPPTGANGTLRAGSGQAS